MASQLDLESVLRTTVHTAMTITGAPYAALGIVGDHGSLVDFVYEGIGESVAEQVGRLPDGKGLLGLITRVGKTVRIDDVSRHPDAAGFPPHHPIMTTFLGVPVRAGGVVFGNLYLTDKPGGFTEEDESTVEALALIAGSALARARLNERLQRATLAEDRERIAREIHDGVIQELFAVGLTLKAASAHTEETEEVRSRIEEAVDRIDGAMTTLRRYIFDIRQPVRTPVRFDVELRRIADQAAHDVSAEVEVVTSGRFADLPDHVSDNALQFAREAVSNAIRHSGAPRIELRAVRRGDWLSLEVHDEGIGFDPGAVRPGLGLDNLRRRVAEAGGATEIHSAPGTGTTVRADLPLR